MIIIFYLFSDTDTCLKSIKLLFKKKSVKYVNRQMMLKYKIKPVEHDFYFRSMNWNLSKECRKKFLKHLLLNASPKLFKVNLKHPTNPSFNLLNNNKQNYLVGEVMVSLRWCQLYTWWKSLKQNFARKLTIHFKILLFLLLFCYVF